MEKKELNMEEMEKVTGGYEKRNEYGFGSVGGDPLYNRPGVAADAASRPNVKIAPVTTQNGTLDVGAIVQHHIGEK